MVPWKTAVMLVDHTASMNVNLCCTLLTTCFTSCVIGMPLRSACAKQNPKLSLLLFHPAVKYPLTILRNIEAPDQGEWERIGSQAVARGQVGLILIATSTTPSSLATPNNTPTLRILQPEFGLPSGKCLLQLLAERVAKVQQLAATSTFGKYSPVTKVVPWYIMVGNKEQKQQLEKHLRAKGSYGLAKGQVEVFVAEGGAPAFNEELKVRWGVGAWGGCGSGVVCGEGEGGVW